MSDRLEVLKRNIKSLDDVKAYVAGLICYIQSLENKIKNLECENQQLKKNGFIED
ncbi:MAG: hypothetical protein K0S61_719 [Anaerocolumna sp.]|jgi:hypothetical protein|nr:hypothetical protein [Anaerocolumna sp.]